MKKTGSKAKSIRKYIYSDNMSFLQKNTKRKETVSSAVEEEEHEEISRDIPTLSDPQPSTSTQGKGKRQKTLVTDIEKSIFKKLQEPEDRHVSFFKGILPSLQKFDDTETLEFQSGVIKIIQSIHRSRQTPKGPVWPVPSEHAIQPSPHMHSYYPDHVKHTHTHTGVTHPHIHLMWEIVPLLLSLVSLCLQLQPILHLFIHHIQYSQAPLLIVVSIHNFLIWILL